MMYGELCTQFYDADKEFAQSNELQLYQDLFGKNDVLFEPMCGSGRLLIPLMQLGYTVHGLDNSPSMLASCRHRAEKLNLIPILTEGTLEDFSNNTKFNGIVIPLGSYQLFYPREHAYKALQIFHNLLFPGGKLVMDLFIPWEAMFENAELDTSARKVQLHQGEIIEIYNETSANKFEQHLLSKTQYKKYSNDTCLLEENEQMDILWYYPFEMRLMLEKYDFKNIKFVTRYLNGGDHLTFIAEV
ncbi:methyltransferase, ubiE/COQ5 family [Legionella geestiana]|uniref:Methyltransferase, ubiE/COQ5 family n=1 Tax=Legionella geestiana TaxID=45065 RepID=A0A0W0U7J9_9GAMM|nr:class I SAM-dependent methyltransferase [Legionella geestiana]KTD04004.1 methyltransferase, ubiE/COQ5 family [Legionella geestiana]QBS12862.1 class I SAM-dependent methyltransferase [Legionella geestiana]STX54652.1 methyltransferase, ubiE/COQ5 family [Legionella geestiana]